MKNLIGFCIVLSLAISQAEVLPSNPGAEVAQDESFDDEQHPQKESFPLQDGYTQARSADLQRYPKTPDFREIASYLNGTHTKWIQKYLRNSEILPHKPMDTSQSVPTNIATKSKRQVSENPYPIARIINDFAFKLIDKLNLTKNFVISPFSIFIALSMSYLGSDGTTKAQMENVLGLNESAMDGEHVHQGMKDMLSLIFSHSADKKLYFANAMFLAQNYTVNPEFERNIQQYYDAELRNLDFGNPEVAAQIINEWVSNNTKNMINRLDSQPCELTRLILLNAIYFKGVWKTQFPRDMTFTGKFFNLDGSHNNASTMLLQEVSFPYFSSSSYQHSFIKFPYKGDEVSMIIALPKDMSGMPMPSMTDEILREIRDSLTESDFDMVSLPKFKVEYSKSLKGPLRRLGISDLFSPGKKNLTGIREKNDLHVSDVVHKAILKVNEQGTTSAAVTSVMFTARSLGPLFIIDHPFAFYIVHEPSGVVLFYGKMFHIGRGAKASVNSRSKKKKGSSKAPG